MSESTIQHLFSSLEHTVRERLDGIREVIQLTRPSATAASPSSNPLHTSPSGMNTTYIPCPDVFPLMQKISSLESANLALVAMLQAVRSEVASLREKLDRKDSVLLPLHPMEGIEVIPKKEVTIPDTEPLSFADRLLLNKKARKALEAEEMGEARVDVYPNSEEVDAAEEEEAAEEAAEEVEEEAAEEVEEEAAEAEGAEEEVEEEVEEEAEEEVEEEAAEEAEEEALEEFEYKGSTYYRDSENNVFMTDEDGELVEEPIGSWNPVKQRIVLTKPTA
jgi:hypothetical protein